jgi:hypothetical protein
MSLQRCQVYRSVAASVAASKKEFHFQVKTLILRSLLYRKRIILITLMLLIGFSLVKSV